MNLRLPALSQTLTRNNTKNELLPPPPNNPSGPRSVSPISPPYQPTHTSISAPFRFLVKGLALFSFANLSQAQTDKSNLICGAFSPTYSSRDSDTHSHVLSLKSSPLLSSSFQSDYATFLDQCSDSTKAFNAFLNAVYQSPSSVFSNIAYEVPDLFPSIKTPVKVGEPTCILPTISSGGYDDLIALTFTQLRNFYYADTYEDRNRYLNHQNGSTFSTTSERTTAANILIQYILENTDPSKSGTNMRSYFETQDDYPRIPRCVTTIHAPTESPTHASPSFVPTFMQTLPDSWGSNKLVCGSYSSSQSIRSVASVRDALNNIFSSETILDSFKVAFENFQKECTIPQKALNAFVAFASSNPTLVFTNASLTAASVIPDLKKPVSISSSSCTVSSISEYGYYSLMDLVFINMKSYIPSTVLEDPYRFLSQSNGDPLQLGTSSISFTNQLIQYAIDHVDQKLTGIDTSNYFQTQTDYPEIPNCDIPKTCQVFKIEMFKLPK